MIDKKLTYTSAKDATIMYESLKGLKVIHYDKLIDEMVRVECVWCDGLVGMVKVESKEDNPNLYTRILSLCKKCVNSYESSVKKLKPKDLGDNLG
jgi:hypothetical protein